MNCNALHMNYNKLKGGKVNVRDKEIQGQEGSGVKSEGKVIRRIVINHIYHINNVYPEREGSRHTW